MHSSSIPGISLRLQKEVTPRTEWEYPSRRRTPSDFGIPRIITVWGLGCDSSITWLGITSKSIPSQVREKFEILTSTPSVFWTWSDTSAVSFWTQVTERSLLLPEDRAEPPPPRFIIGVKRKGPDWTFGRLGAETGARLPGRGDAWTLETWISGFFISL